MNPSGATIFRYQPPENYNVNPAGTFASYVTDFDPDPSMYAYTQNPSTDLWRWSIYYHDSPVTSHFNIKIITREANQIWKFKMSPYSFYANISNFFAIYNDVYYQFPWYGQEDVVFEGIGSGTIHCLVGDLTPYDWDRAMDGVFFFLDGSGDNYYEAGEFQIYVKSTQSAIPQHRTENVIE